MKTFTLTLLVNLLTISVFGQISFFKDINPLEDGSNPSNFVEANGFVFFIAKTIDGNRLWKTDGSEAGTIQISDKEIYSYGDRESILPTFQIINDEVYYFVSNGYLKSQLWKTNGYTETLVLDDLFTKKLYFLNNKIVYLQYKDLFTIENGNKILYKHLESYPIVNQPSPEIINNNLLFFTNDKSTPHRLKVWKTDGTEIGTTPISNIDSMLYLNNVSRDYELFSKKIGNKLFFILERLIYDKQNNVKYVTDIWKSDENQCEMVKRIYTRPTTAYPTATNLGEFNGKLIFMYSNKDLWITNGDSSGTKLLRSFQFLGYDINNKKWGVLNNKFYFSAQENNDYELWESDGTSSGTVLFKDINLNGSSSPHYFYNLNNTLFFKANLNEVWKTDGTNTGTTMVVDKIPAPSYLSQTSVIPEFIHTSTNQLLFRNYDKNHDFELWKVDISTQSTTLVKNIVTNSKGSSVRQIKIKVGDIWYFTAKDHRGAELWKSDGTPEGTQIVKDINVGDLGIYMREMVAVGNTVYFTANLENESTMRLFKSDGTEAGTFEIELNSNYQYPVNPTNLVATDTKVFFVGLYAGKNHLWVLDSRGVQPVNTSISYNSINNLIKNKDNVLFTAGSGELWFSDGTQANTKSVFGNDFFDTPRGPVCLVEFKGKIYFFSSYFQQGYIYKEALFETDGTKLGTKVIKEFNTSNRLFSSYAQFFGKSSDRLYFRADFNSNFGSQSFDLWTSDGTTNGTYFLKKVPFEGSLRISSNFIDNKFILFLSNRNSYNKFYLWSSDGSVEGTNKIYENTFSFIDDHVLFNRKIYFSYDDLTYGNELWATDGTINGTQRITDVRLGAKNFSPSNFLNFDYKLVFWGFHDNHGHELWQYIPPSCENNLNFTINSGEWSNPVIWSCGRIPDINDRVIIRNIHKITVPSSLNARCSTINIQKGSVFEMLPNSNLGVFPK